MIQFLGNIEAKADAKGRVFSPSHLPETAAGRFRRKARVAQGRISGLPGALPGKCTGLPPKTNFAAGSINGTPNNK